MALSLSSIAASRGDMARPRANDYEQKRLSILTRAARLFAENGYGGASTAMIAKACGVSKALMYHYYNSKDDVLFDILDHHLKQLVDTAEAASRSVGSPEERLFAISSALLNAYRGADAEHQVQISSLTLLPSAQQEVLKSLERRLVAIVSEAIATAIPSVAKRRDVLTPLAMSLFGMLNWHFLWFREGKGLTREAYARMATTLILSGAETAISAVEGRAKLSPKGTSPKPKTIGAGAKSGRFALDDLLRAKSDRG
jgi:AcrR family transcriptional regulator